jgi:hypothetical protein
MFEAGMILLPDDAEWADDYIESMTRFPKGQHDDNVDSTSQALNYLRPCRRAGAFHRRKTGPIGPLTGAKNDPARF